MTIKEFAKLAEGMGLPGVYTCDGSSVQTPIQVAKPPNDNTPMARLLDGNELVVLVYTSDYDAKRYRVALDEPAMFKAVLGG